MLQLISDLTEDLKNKAIKLDSIGIDGYAWDISDTYLILDILRGTSPKAIVLGGDLLLRRPDSQLEYMHENWSYEPVKTDDDSEMSIKKAKEFLDAFAKRHDGQNVYIDLVLAEIT